MVIFFWFQLFIPWILLFFGFNTLNSTELEGNTYFKMSQQQPKPQQKSKLIIVANRLPVSIIKDSNSIGGYKFVPSSGGLASALSGCKKKMDFTVGSFYVPYLLFLFSYRKIRNSMFTFFVKFLFFIFCIFLFTTYSGLDGQVSSMFLFSTHWSTSETNRDFIRSITLMKQNSYSKTFIQSSILFNLNWCFTGFDVPDIDREFITKRLQSEYSCKPVYLSKEVAERYYNGFSNSILWPLFHCKLVPASISDLVLCKLVLVRGAIIKSWWLRQQLNQEGCF